jgi:hypothetical protein
MAFAKPRPMFKKEDKTVGSFDVRRRQAAP